MYSGYIRNTMKNLKVYHIPQKDDPEKLYQEITNVSGNIIKTSINKIPYIEF